MCYTTNFIGTTGMVYHIVYRFARITNNTMCTPFYVYHSHLLALHMTTGHTY